PANVIRNFHERSSQSLQRALRKDDLVVGGERGKLVAMRAEGKPRKFGDFLCCTLRKFRMRVQPGAHGRPADGEVVETLERLLQAFDVPLQQAGAGHQTPDRKSTRLNSSHVK